MLGGQKGSSVSWSPRVPPTVVVGAVELGGQGGLLHGRWRPYLAIRRTWIDG